MQKLINVIFILSIVTLLLFISVMNMSYEDLERKLKAEEQKNAVCENTLLQPDVQLSEKVKTPQKAPQKEDDDILI